MALVPLARGGDGGGHDDMEARLQRVEEAMLDIRGVLHELRTDVGHMSSDLRDLRSDVAAGQKQLFALTGEIGEIKGKMTYIPNIFHMITLVSTMLAFSFAIIRYGVPH